MINQNASQIGVSWLLQSNNFPSTSAANTNGTVEGDGEATSASGAMIVRGDTLERNPGFINPMEMTERPVEEGQQPEPEQQKITEVKVEGAAGAVSQQYIITNEDNTVTVVQHTDMAQWQQLSADDAIAMASGANSSPTGSSPADKAWPGDHGFRMNFMKLSQNAKNKSWDVSYWRVEQSGHFFPFSK